MFVTHDVFELERFPSGGGFPKGMLEFCFRALEVPRGRESEVLHLCSGSLQAARTVDLREGLGATVRADIRWLPFRPGSIDWIVCDPPYGQDYAEELWGLGREYPTPAVIMEECAQVLAPGGKLAFLHFVVPRVGSLRRLRTIGVTTGPGYRIRALTICERPLQGALDL
jgi:SAM-dependent methyltransferase